MKPKHFLNQLEHDAIVAAIRRAEALTTGRVHVSITHRKPTEILAAAKAAFTKLRLARSAQRNNVLIFIAPRSHSFAIVGDEAVHARCGDAFWTAVVGEMRAHLREARPTQAIIQGVEKAGVLLAEHFPRRSSATISADREITDH